MDILTRIRHQLAEDRFAANLIAFYGLIVVAVIVSLVLRRLLTRGGHRLVRATGVQWLHGAGDEIIRHARSLLFWGTLVAVLITTAIGLGYHFTGGDIRQDVTTWFQHWTPADVIRLGLQLGAVVGLLVAAWMGAWSVRRLRHILESHLKRWLGRAGNEESLRVWFQLLERYGVTSVRLLALWGSGHFLGLGDLTDKTVGFFLRVSTILVVARLLTLACRALTKIATDLGNRHLARGGFRRYWERLTRLFPFGQRCFETAVYVAAASMCVRELAFIAVVAHFGDRIVACIGIFFGTRMVIELLQVFLNEAFGMYDDARPTDQKGRTLVPLLQSVSQYVLYFGSGVVMLDVLGINTQPILAGAGILGLGVGLGAQNLVTDVVSGFFILFEGQYLVGDYVQVGDAAGTVESVSIRLTQIRDAHGKLHIIPNGQIKAVVNYSKGYVNAVVDLRVPAGTDVEGVFRAMTEAGRRLRKARKEVLADTEIHGLVDMGTSEMTVRAVTRVEPGTHGMMQSEYRRLLKQVFDETKAASRTALAA